MKENEEYLKSYTAEVASLADICRRQNISRSLTHIPDSIFQFFIKLCESCLKLLVSEHLNTYGEQMYSFCSGELLHNKELSTCFRETVFARMNNHDIKITSVFKTEESKVDYVDRIYQELVNKFLLVLFSQFRKDLKSSYHVEKTLAHRKQIQISKQKKEKVNKIVKNTVDVISTTTSTVSEPVRVSDGEYPGTSGCAKEAVKRGRKKQQKKSISQAIKNYPGSKLNKDGEMIWMCPNCGEVEDDIQPMICCDECDDWFHWTCVGICQEPAEELWFCPDCNQQIKKRKTGAKGRRKKSTKTKHF